MATLTLQPAAGDDAYLNNDLPDNNYGANTAAPVYGNAGKTGIVRFDLSSIAGATVSAATMYLYHVSGYYGGSPTCIVHRILDANDWVEAESTYNDAKTGSAWAGSSGCATSGTDYDATAAGTPAAVTDSNGFEIVMAFDANGIADVQSQVDGTNNGWRIIAPAGANYFQPALSDHATAAYRPKLVVNYTPVGGGDMLTLGVG